MVKNDCTVRAVSLALEVPYESVRQAFTEFGYKPGNRFRLDRWIACVTNPAIGEGSDIFGFTPEWVGASAIKGRPRHTLETFTAEYPVGRYIVRQARHVVAVVDGRILMESRRPGGAGCVYGAWRFTKA